MDTANRLNICELRFLQSLSCNVYPRKTVEAFDGKIWHQEPQLKVARHYPAAAELGHVLYVMGGNDGGGKVKSVEAFDGVHWTAAPSRDPLGLVFIFFITL